MVRDPADWARQFGWVSRLRAERAAARLVDLARVMRETDPSEDGEESAGEMWAQEAEAVARYLVPKAKAR